MRTSKTKTFSFREEYFPELDYLNSIKNASEYICELVRRDLSDKNNPEELAKQVEVLLMKIEDQRQNKKY